MILHHHVICLLETPYLSIRNCFRYGQIEGTSQDSTADSVQPLFAKEKTIQNLVNCDQMRPESGCIGSHHGFHGLLDNANRWKMAVALASILQKIN